MGDLSWRQKEVISDIPAGQLLCSLQLLRRSELAPKGTNSEVPAGEFCANGVRNSNMGFKSWSQGRVYQDLKKRISLCTA